MIDERPSLGLRMPTLPLFTALPALLTRARDRESGVYPPQQFDRKIDAVPECQLACGAWPAVET